jgi:hypothetical protein
LIPYFDRYLPHSTFGLYIILNIITFALLFIPHMTNTIIEIKTEKLNQRKSLLKLINFNSISIYILTGSQFICTIISFISMLARERVIDFGRAITSQISDINKILDFLFILLCSVFIIFHLSRFVEEDEYVYQNMISKKKKIILVGCLLLIW